MTNTFNTAHDPRPSLTVRPDDVQRRQISLVLELDQSARQFLCDLHGLAALHSFRFVGTAQGLSGRKIELSGTLTAKAELVCGVTLKTFNQDDQIPIRQIFAPDDPAADTVDIDPLAEADIEPFVDGQADLASVIYQEFAVHLDPHPRHPDIAKLGPSASQVVSEDDDTASNSPFAVLEQLKRAH